MFLRQVEHRIQYLDDQQTHVLPTQRRRPGLDRPAPWVLPTAAPSFARAGHPPRTGGAGVRHACWAARPKQCKGCNGPAQGGTAGHDRFGKPAGTAARRLSRARGRVAQHPRVLACARNRAHPAGAPGAAHRPVAGKAGSAKRPPCAWPTGSSPCCAAKVTWPCCWSAPRCTSGCCACWAQRAGRRATCCNTPA
jgi:hypothetical protein